MTALTEYERLECTGLWRAPPETDTPDSAPQRREVVVSFGSATLILSDKNDIALTHWSLPAIRRVNPDTLPAVFSPDSGSLETLEIDDDTMIEAIEKIRRTIEKQRPKPGRLRIAIFAGILASVAAISVFWLPGALVKHTASVVPHAQRIEIGTRLLGNIFRVSGDACATPTGVTALTTLSRHLFNTPDNRLVVLPSGMIGAKHLPGGFILLNRSLAEDYEEPDVMAGFALAENIRAQANDPLHSLLNDAGFLPTFKLLTTGVIDDSALETYAEHLLMSATVPVDTRALLAAFGAVNLRSSPYAYALDPTGETTFELIEADPFSVTAPRSILTDGEWIGIQGICGE
jgi:hypothetical protein